MNKLCEKYQKSQNATARFCGNEVCLFIELSAKAMKPRQIVKPKNLAAEAKQRKVLSMMPLSSAKLEVKRSISPYASKRSRAGLRSSAIGDPQQTLVMDGPHRVSPSTAIRGGRKRPMTLGDEGVANEKKSKLNILVPAADPKDEDEFKLKLEAKELCNEDKELAPDELTNPEEVIGEANVDIVCKADLSVDSDSMVDANNLLCDSNSSIKYDTSTIVTKLSSSPIEDIFVKEDMSNCQEELNESIKNLSYNDSDSNQTHVAPEIAQNESRENTVIQIHSPKMEVASSHVMPMEIDDRPITVLQLEKHQNSAPSSPNESHRTINENEMSSVSHENIEKCDEANIVTTESEEPANNIELVDLTSEAPSNLRPVDASNEKPEISMQTDTKLAKEDEVILLSDSDSKTVLVSKTVDCSEELHEEVVQNLDTKQDESALQQSNKTSQDAMQHQPIETRVCKLNTENDATCVGEEKQLDPQVDEPSIVDEHESKQQTVAPNVNTYDDIKESNVNVGSPETIATDIESKGSVEEKAVESQEPELNEQEPLKDAIASQIIEQEEMHRDCGTPAISVESPSHATTIEQNSKSPNGTSSVRSEESINAPSVIQNIAPEVGHESEHILPVPTVDCDEFASDKPSSDIAQLKKLVPEVCACDTTTGSTDDEFTGIPSLTTSTPEEPMAEVISDKSTSPPTIPTTESTAVMEQKKLIKVGRQEWAKELTKIRMRMKEKKRLMRQVRVQRALVTRKGLKKPTPDITKENSADVNTCNVDDSNPTISLETPTNTETENTGVTSEKALLTSQLSEAPCAVGIELPEGKLSDDSEMTFDESKSDSKSADDANNSSHTNEWDTTKSSNTSFAVPSIEEIEIVEDDEEDEPWPFQGSPLSNADVEEPALEAPSTPAEPRPNSQRNIFPNGEDNELFLPSVKTSEPFTSYIESPHARFVNARANKISNSTPTNSFDIYAEANQHASTSAGPHATLVGKVDVTVGEQVRRAGVGKNILSTVQIRDLLAKKAPKVKSKKSLAETLDIVQNKSESEQPQHAKMQSRSNENLMNDSIPDSMWRDIFNSEATPLDFEVLKSGSKKRKDDETQLFPAVYQKSCLVMSNDDVIDLSKDSLKTSGKRKEYINTPCGDSYIATNNVVEPLTMSNIKLCSCKSEGSLSPGKDQVHIMFCQAVETVDNSVVNCVNKVTDRLRIRASSRLPRMVLCKHHRRKLTQHGSCPVCGLFCTVGTFLDCTSGKGHLYHPACEIKAEDGTSLCPHCGEKSMRVEQTLTSKRKTELQRTRQPSKKESNEGIARMCIRLVTRPTSSVSEDSSHSSYEHKLFEVSKSKLLNGAEKSKLITIMSSLSHLVPSMREKLSSTAGTTSLYDLSSYILKNDLSQLALGICDVMRNKEEAEGKFALDKQFSEQSGKTLLHLAVQSNSLANVHCLVMAGVSLNSTDFKGISPLMCASKGNQLDILKYLIGAGALVEWRDVDGMTPLHVAAVAGNKAICEYLLNDVRANIDCVDEGGWSPLVWAIENGHTHVVKLLLNCEANIHKRDSEGNASIHWGAYSGNTDIIKLLITKGADIEAVNELGDRPLHIAVRQARTDAVILLLSHGVDTSAINNLHQTPAECCHGACSENMRSFLTVNDVLRSCKLGGIITRSPKLLHQDIARGKERVPIPVTNCVDDTNYPTDFIYVTESVWTSPIPTNTMINSLVRCNCTGDCSRASCACSRSSISCWYEAGGLLVPEFDYGNPPQIFECNKACGCWATCANRIVQQGITAQLELFKTKHRGWGVRARHEILRGTYVCEYVGELITDSEADKREDDSYLFDLDYKDGDTYCMDAKRYGNISRFINHRCEPNLTPVSVFIDHQDLRFPRICLFANTDIEPGTELGFDYGEKFWLVKYKHFLCDCGCKTCKYNKVTIHETLAQHQAATKSPSTSTLSRPK